MKTFKIGAIVAAVTGAVALSLAPAFAATTVNTVSFGANTLRFDYTLDTNATVTTTLPFAEGCADPRSTSDFGTPPPRYTTATFNVAQSGTYTLGDASPNGFGASVPAARNTSASDGWGVIYAASGVSGNLDSGPTCLLGVDNFSRSVSLEAETTYVIALANNPYVIDTFPSSYSLVLFGPGAVNPGPFRLAPEQALAACTEGSDAPTGYTLREGTARSETLTGTAGNDVIRGLGGNDTIRGLGGDDIVCGGEGQDTIDGGAGNDFVFGEASQDVLSGGVGDDYIDGGLGNDVLNGNDGADELVGGDGQDTLYGQAGDDELFGGAGQDVLDGGAGADVGTDTDPRSVFRNIETVNGPPAPGPQPTSTATR